MTRLPRPCLGYRDPQTRRQVPCGVPAVGGRCPACAARHDASRRPSAYGRGYDAAYQAERAELLGPDANGRPPACALRLEGCTYWATTADHVVPRIDGARVPDSAGGRLLQPACAHCNGVKSGKVVPPIDGAIRGVETRESDARMRAEVRERIDRARNEYLGPEPDDPWFPEP